NTLPSESRYQPLLAVQPAITGNQTQTVADFIATRVGSLVAAASLQEQLAALDRLKALPTARIERAFADHIDCCSYRPDAWQLGLVHCQLAQMRNVRDGQATEARRGLYLGAYAWLEPLRPEPRMLSAVELRDPDLARDFADPERRVLMRDETNQGYVHAP